MRRVEVGDCLEVLERLPADSVDAVVTDPPYGLEFMGAEWDKPWAVGFRALGHEGAEGRAALPQHGSGRNPMCRSCSKHKRGSDRCRCDAPDFDESPAQAMRAFQSWSERWARACLRVLKPGGHLLAFGGTRTYHRLACAVEDAGFEIRDRTLTLNGHVLGPELDWLYGSGWPKSRNIGKAIDKRAGADREVVGRYQPPNGQTWNLERDESALGYGGGVPRSQAMDITAPATDEAAEWEGWGTALKPAHEPIVVARKPFRGTVEEQVLATGTGALNIDGCRIDTGGETISVPASDPANRRGVVGQALQASDDVERNHAAQRAAVERANALGRWPANVVLLHASACQRVGTRRVPTGVTVRRNLDPAEHEPSIFRKRNHPDPTDVTYGDGDGLETIEAWECAPGCPVAQLDGQSGELRSGDPTAVGDPARRAPQNAYVGESRAAGTPIVGYGDAGGASRFFYSGKASPAEREYGLDPAGERIANTHPTVKPIDLMRWLVRLVTPPGGTVLDPFTGSGSTGCAAALEGVGFLGIERDETFAAIARARLEAWEAFPPGTSTDAVVAADGARRRTAAEAEERRRELASAGQLDLLAGEG